MIIGRYADEAVGHSTELVSARIEAPDGTVAYDGLSRDDNFRLIDLSDGTLYVKFTVRGEDGTSYIFVANSGEYSRQYIILLITIVALDLLRVLSLIANRRRLATSILKPIDEIAQAARNLSASNLDMRINILGTKNELRDLASVINDMLDRIEAAYESQKAFVSDASHELRTPISVIRGYAQLLERWGMSDPEVAKEAIGAISSEAESMNELVEKLLFLARHDKKT
ncbi:MAG: HAMP domain-containing protein, partial [Clostridiales bacterium]|nr:HAMP domain-containing protein [Clostridiales bacterium]